MGDCGRRALLAGFCGAALLPLGSARAQSPGAGALIEAMRAGGLTIYIRHGETTWMGVDEFDWPRERQRLLSDAGAEQARMIGRVFRQRDIPVGEVLASPFSRCVDTAEAAFGRVEIREPLRALRHDEHRATRIGYLRALLARPPAAGNRVVVGHNFNIQAVGGPYLDEAGAAVIRADGAGFVVLGVIRATEWQTLDRPSSASRATGAPQIR